MEAFHCYLGCLISYHTPWSNGIDMFGFPFFAYWDGMFAFQERAIKDEAVYFFFTALFFLSAV